MDDMETRRATAERALRRLQDQGFIDPTPHVGMTSCGQILRGMWVEYEDESGIIRKLNSSQNPKTGEWQNPWETTPCR